MSKIFWGTQHHPYNTGQFIETLIDISRTMQQLLSENNLDYFASRNINVQTISI